jgi:hypothetical protein
MAMLCEVGTGEVGAEVVRNRARKRPDARGKKSKEEQEREREREGVLSTRGGGEGCW